MNSLRSRGTEARRAACAALAAAARDLFDMGRNDLALPVAKMALEEDPSFGNAHSTMAGILDTFGQFEEALQHWGEAARLTSGSAQQQLNHALAVLGEGDWEIGLPLYESRMAAANWASAAVRDGWDKVSERRLRPGMSLRDKKVLVVAEQGLGDTIWSLRFLHRLAAEGAHVTLAASAKLKPLLESLSPLPELLSPPPEIADARLDLVAASRQCDYILPAMSLPWILGVRPAVEYRGPVPYLVPDTGMREVWRAKYQAALPRAERFVGVIWRVNPEGVAARARSIAVTELAPLGDLEGVGFVNLQGGGPEGRAALATVLPRVYDPLAGDGVGMPLNAFAAAMAATDIVLSVDTMGAHLAGAMGHPGIVLMPTAPSFMFYWGHRGEGTTWYPSLRLVRQSCFGDWQQPVSAARVLLANEFTGG